MRTTLRETFSSRQICLIGFCCTKNPQARREVIGQVLEYAGLMRRLSYGDLSALVATRIGRQASNLLWELARDRLSLTDEAAFVDAVSDSLSAGAFDLVVLGDGIRLESVDAFVSTDEEAQLAWLVQTSDRLVSAFRPRLSALG